MALFLNSPRAVHVHIYGETLRSKQRIPNALHVVKLHGDLLFEDLGNLEHEMDGRVDEVMTEVLGELLEGAALLTVGYGCQDQNVRRLLEHIASSPRGMDGGFFSGAMVACRGSFRSQWDERNASARYGHSEYEPLDRAYS